MKYKRPSLLVISLKDMFYCACVSGDQASAGITCNAGPEASGGCGNGAAASTQCLEGAAAGSKCDNGVCFD